MPGSRPGLLAVRLALLVGLPVRRPLVGRLAWIWLLLSVSLPRRIRRNAMGLRAKRRARPHRLLITLGDSLRVAGGVPARRTPFSPAELRGK